MNEVLLATIPAVLVLAGMLGVQHIQSRRETKGQALEREREIRDARREYRESIVNPIREAMIKLGTNLEYSRFMDVLRETNKKYYLMDEEETRKFKKSISHVRRGSKSEILIELMPLIHTITSEEARTAILQAIAYIALFKETKKLGNITEEDITQKVKVAYQKLEDYVALAD